MKLAPRGTAAALSVAALLVSLGVGAAATTAAVAAAPTTTGTSSTTVTTSDQNLIRTWNFENGDLSGVAGLGGASVTIDAAGRQDGALGLHVGQAANYGAGFSFALDASGLAAGWYDLSFPVKLAAGEPIRMQATTPGSATPPTWVNTGWTAGPSVHFQKLATTTRVSVNVTSIQVCPSDPARPPAEFAVDNVRLRRSGTQGAIPYPTIGCPGTTTTPVSTTTPVTTSPAVTTSPGTVLKRWDFGTSDLAAWSPYQGTTLGTQSDPAGGTDLVVSGAGAYGSGATVMIDGSNLTDNTWYDLGMDLRLPAGSPTTLYRAQAPSSWDPAGTITDAAWRGVRAPFRKFAGQTQIPVNVFSITDCAADTTHAPGTFLSDGASLMLSTNQYEITWTTTGCPTITTSRPVTTTTTTSPTSPPVQCRVVYSESRWSGGFQGTIALTNTGSTTLSGWKLTFTLSNGQLQSAWPVGGFGQAGTLVTISAPAWTPDLAPGQTVQLGFVASGTGSASDFRLNGVACSGSAVTSTTSYNNNS